MKILYSLIVLTLFISCEISAVNYAVDDVEILGKRKITLGTRPAVEVELRNSTEAPVYDVTITVKAKKNQRDVAQSTSTFTQIAASQTEKSVLVLSALKDHTDYDFLTFAVTFSRQGGATLPANPP